MSAIDRFAALHRPKDPLILFNIWDAGSAAAVARAGAKAVATGSHSVAGAQGYADGQELPFENLLKTVSQIVGAIDLPLSVDFEAGFAESLEELAANAAALAGAGAIGCNFEDQLIGEKDLREASEQAERIRVVGEAGLFVNARTDTFLLPLMNGIDPNTEQYAQAAITRGIAYRNAGAGSFFVPGLSSPELIERICQAVDLPINVMRLPGMVSNEQLARLGVARISYGPAPWRDAMAAIEEAAQCVFGEREQN